MRRRDTIGATISTSSLNHLSLRIFFFLSSTSHSSAFRHVILHTFYGPVHSLTETGHSLRVDSTWTHYSSVPHAALQRLCHPFPPSISRSLLPAVEV